MKKIITILLLLNFIISNVNAFSKLNCISVFNKKIPIIAQNCKTIYSIREAEKIKNVLKTNEFKKILIHNNITHIEIKEFHLIYVGTGSEKIIFKLKIIYIDDTYKYLKIASFHQPEYIHNNYIYNNIPKTMQSFYWRYNMLNKYNLFDKDKGILIPYYEKIDEKGIVVGQWQKGKKTGFLSFAIPYSANLILFCMTLDKNDKGLTYRDIRNDNIIEIDSNHKKKFHQIFKIIDYPLGAGENCSTIRWVRLDIQSYFIEREYLLTYDTINALLGSLIYLFNASHVYSLVTKIINSIKKKTVKKYLQTRIDKLKKKVSAKYIKLKNKLNRAYIIQHRANDWETIYQAMKDRVYGLEIDLHLTKDEEIILIHDPKITYKNKEYNTCELTLAELKEAYNGKELLTLQDFLNLPYMEDMKLIIHIHNWFSSKNGYNKKTTKNIVKILKNTVWAGDNFINNVDSFISFDLEQLRLIRELLPKASIAYCVDDHNEKGLYAIDVKRHYSRPELIQRLLQKKINKVVYPATALTYEAIDELKEASISILSGVTIPLGFENIDGIVLDNTKELKNIKQKA